LTVQPAADLTRVVVLPPVAVTLVVAFRSSLATIRLLLSIQLPSALSMSPEIVTSFIWMPVATNGMPSTKCSAAQLSSVLSLALAVEV
jgi:hypothetical protein